jgi:hypothetical protein
MTDLTVDYVVLDGIARSLSRVIAEFETMHERRDEDAPIWGGPRVRSAMGQFASNWDIHREALSEQIRALGEKCAGVAEEFRTVDEALARSYDRSTP